MDRRSAYALLAVFGAGVFLAGLELMITAVALPSILADLVDASGSTAWQELRKASWIVNGCTHRLLVGATGIPTQSQQELSVAEVSGDTMTVLGTDGAQIGQLDRAD